MNSDVQRDYLRHRKLEAFALSMLKRLFRVEFRLASESEDRWGFDAVSADGVIRAGCRSRGAAYAKYNDFTIRSGRDSGANTEWAKVIMGRQHVMLYAFEPAYAKYVVVDFRGKLDALPGIADDTRENGDGTYFRPVPFGKAWDAGMVVAHHRFDHGPATLAAFQTQRQQLTRTGG